MGRAGQEGTAYNFICPDEEGHARDLVHALVSSNQEVPEPLQKLADG